MHPMTDKINSAPAKPIQGVPLPIHTYDDIVALGPCYDPAERRLCTRDWHGTALDVLRAEGVSSKDQLWLVLREAWIPAYTLHEFAVWCAEQALARVAPDPRSVRALEVKRAWLDGLVTDEELADAAWAAAGTAAGAAAWDAAEDAQCARLIAMLEEITR